MHYDIIKNWFEDDFSNLDPLLQKLHLSGGELSENIDISYGKRIAGLIGRIRA